MKKLFLSTSIAALFLIGSAFMPPPAIVTDEHEEYSDAFNFFSECNGENIAFTFTTTIDAHSVINGNRDNVHIHFQTNYKGTGDLGNTYKGLGNENRTQNASFQNGAVTYNDVFTVTIVGKAGTPNFIVKQTFKITINAKGDITVEKGGEQTIECKG